MRNGKIAGKIEKRKVKTKRGDIKIFGNFFLPLFKPGHNFYSSRNVGDVGVKKLHTFSGVDNENIRHNFGSAL